MTDHCYGIDDAATIDLIRPELARWFDGIRETTGSESIEVLDSFDWRLFNHGWLLLHTQGRYSLVDIRTRQTVGALTADEKKPMRFHWDFPESQLATCFKAVLEVRALLPLGVFTRWWVHCDLLNSDEKIVARLALETYTANGGSQAVHQCRVTRVRGYPKPVKRIAACLNQLGLKPAEQSPYLTLLEGKGLSPGGYSSKIKVSLQPEMRAAGAIRRILDNLTTVMHLNISGVREDIDSEFLHDFRVSVRRARSLLSQMKGVLDAETTARLQQRLKAIGDITGTVRDLDVYLLKESAYTGLLPAVPEAGHCPAVPDAAAKTPVGKEPDGQGHGRYCFFSRPCGPVCICPGRSGDRIRRPRRQSSHRGAGQGGHFQTLPSDHQAGQPDLGRDTG